jgi:hypothetical protein
MLLSVAEMDAGDISGYPGVIFWDLKKLARHENATTAGPL